MLTVFHMKPWPKKEGCIPPESHADFVGAMEDVREVYKPSYDAKNPLICMDETRKQPVKEVRERLSAEPGKTVRCFIKPFSHKKRGAFWISSIFITLPSMEVGSIWQRLN